MMVVSVVVRFPNRGSRTRKARSGSFRAGLAKEVFRSLGGRDRPSMSAMTRLTAPATGRSAASASTFPGAGARARADASEPASGAGDAGDAGDAGVARVARDEGTIEEDGRTHRDR